MIPQEILKKHKLRSTPNRNTILNAFLQHKGALSNSDLEGQIENIDRITLYRTLKTFEDKGIIHQAIDGTTKIKYALCVHDCDEDHHHDYHAHFSCTDCEKTYCIDEIVPPTFSTPPGFSLKKADIILKGVCKDCNS